MRNARLLLAGTLVLLFLGLSFNAYACLVPLYGAADAMMGSDCSSPEEQPARQFCDAFKTLGVQSITELQQAIDCQLFCPEDIAWSSLLFQLAAHSNRLSEHPGDGPPQDILLKTAVLRI
ncbi:MAG: hypothetical protein ACREIH_03365 [Nitrospiraceae bacterium]